MISITVYNILGLAVLANLVTHWFQPIQSAKWRVIRFFKFSATTQYLIRKGLTCSKCLSLWSALILFQDVFVAALCSLVGYLINHLIDRIEAWYE